MEVIFEAIGELLVELLFTASTNSKIPIWIRIPLIIILLGFYLFIVGICIVCGIKLLQSNCFLGILLIIVGILIMIGFFYIFYKHKKS